MAFFNGAFPREIVARTLPISSWCPVRKKVLVVENFLLRGHFRRAIGNSRPGLLLSHL